MDDNVQTRDRLLDAVGTIEAFGAAIAFEAGHPVRYSTAFYCLNMETSRAWYVGTRMPDGAYILPPTVTLPRIAAALQQTTRVWIVDGELYTKVIERSGYPRKSLPLENTA